MTAMQEMELSEFISLRRGHDLSESQRHRGEIPIVSSSGITGWHNEAKVKGPGVVTGRYGTLGEIHYVEGDYWPLNTTLYVDDFKGNHPKFVYYFLQTLDFARFNGAGAVPGVNRNVLKKIKIRVPPKLQHIKIATVLSAYDDLIALNQRRIQLLEESARLLYREWFVKLRFPGYESVAVKDGLPEGWEHRALGDVCEAIGGGTPSTTRMEYWDGNVTWITPTDVTRNDCLVLLDSEKKITDLGLQNSSAKLVPPDTILMTSRASVGFFALMDKPVCTNQGFISIIPNQDEARMFLLFHLLDGVEKLRSRATGTTFKELSKKTFRGLPIIWPDSSILKRFNEYAYQLIIQIRVLKMQIEKLKQARDLLLPKLMSGALDVSRIPLPDEAIINITV